MAARSKRDDSTHQAITDSVTTQTGGVNFEWILGSSHVDVDTDGTSDPLDAPKREFPQASRAPRAGAYEAVGRRAAQRRNRALYLAGALIVALLAGLAASLVGIPWSETTNRDAPPAAQQAEFASVVQTSANVQVARAEQLAAQAHAALAHDPQRGILVAIEALKIAAKDSTHRIPPAADALWQTLSPLAEIQLSVPEPVGAVALSSDGRWLASKGSGGTVLLQDAMHPALVPEILREHKFAVRALAFSVGCISLPGAPAERCGRWLATGSLDNTARLWDITAGAPTTKPIVLRGHQAGIEAVSFSPDGRWLATGSKDGTIRLWDVSASVPTPAFLVLPGHETWVVDLAFSDDGRWLATRSLDNVIRLWDVSPGAPATEPRVRYVYPGTVTAMQFSGDGQWLAAGGSDGMVRLWRVTAVPPRSRPSFLLNSVNAVMTLAFSEDGRWLASGSRGLVRLWDLSLGPLRKGSLTLLSPRSDVLMLAFSQDGHWLAAGSQDGITRLWDVASGAPMTGPTVLRGHGSPIAVVAFSRDGHWLAAGNEDGTLRWWLFRWNEMIEVACRAAGRNFTRAEWQQYFPQEPYRNTCEQWPGE